MARPIFSGEIVKADVVQGPLRDPSPRGALWVYAAKAESQLVEVTLENYPEDADFHPLGVDVFPGSSPSDPAHILVVNHGRNFSTIEQFSLSPVAPYRATYVRTLTSPHFVAPNGLVFTSRASFYVTQDHRFTRRLPGWVGKILPVVESLLLPGLAWVNHVEIRADGQLNVTYAARGIAFPNGIAMTGNGKTVAVASTTQGGIQFYSRTGDNRLKFEETVLVPFSPDNIGFEDDGKLIVAGHPNFPAISAVAAQKREHAPSWVVSIVPRTKPFNASDTQQEDTRAPYSVTGRTPISRSHEVKTLYQSDGTAFSTSATGLWDARSGTFFAAGLYQEGILSCQG
jgi:hypothetical protein